MNKESYVTELSIDQDVQKVKEIIEKQLAISDTVSKYYVILMVKTRHNPSLLHNRAIAAGKATNNGMRNIENGAKVIFRHAMKRLKEHYVLDKKGWVKRRRKPLTYDQAIEAYLGAMDSTRLMPTQPNKELSEVKGTTWFLRNVNGPLARVNHKGDVRPKGALR